MSATPARRTVEVLSFVDPSSTIGLVEAARTRTTMADSLSDPATWLERYGDALYRYALGRLRDRSRAEDAVQDALLAALQARDGFRGGSTEQTWLTGILRHKVLDQLRAQGRAAERETDTVDEDELERLHFAGTGSWRQPAGRWNDPEGALGERQFFINLERCIEELPERLGQAFMLKEFDGLAGAEIGQTLGVTSNNVWVMLSRARMRIRNCLERTWFDRSAT